MLKMKVQNYVIEYFLIIPFKIKYFGSIIGSIIKSFKTNPHSQGLRGFKGVPPVLNQLIK